jgi:small-conductance mechanosensitive channel
MAIRIFDLLARTLIAGALCFGVAAASLAQPAGQPDQGAQQPAARPSPDAAIAPLGLKLRELETAARRDGLSDDGLATLREGLDALREDLRNATDALQQRLNRIDARLKELAPQPAAGTSQDSEVVVAERIRLSDRRTEIDSALKQVRLMALRADALTTRITERRRELFARELFVRASSALYPSFWADVAQAFLEEIRGLMLLGRSWGSYALDTGGATGLIAAALTLAVFAFAAIALMRWFARRAIAPAAQGTRFAKAFTALTALLRAALVMPAAVLAIVLVLEAFGLVPETIMQIGMGLIAATAVASIGRGVAIGLFAADEPDRRLLALDDATARRLAEHLTLAARILGVVVLLGVLQKAVAAPVSMTVAMSVLLAALVAALLVHLLLRLGRDESTAEFVGSGHWLRGAGWLVTAAILVALATGYIGFAAFLAGRLLVILAVSGALYIGLVFIDALFSEVLTANTPRGRAVAAMLGLTPASLELAGTLLSAVIRVLLVLVVALPLLGPWGIFAADFFGVVRDAAFGIRIGEFTISVTAILAAFVVLLIGVLATRAAQGWLQTRFLPRTRLEPGLQHSVSVIFGYVGVITALSLALVALGIDLQKITLVAGALSIGIGFGLQSIVSNFVSGLILLAERPIRVGDMIVVKGEEGYVRRIRVRATEIETFERASVIIPNSELITGVVKNWTHVNTLGRISVKVGVGYDSNAEQVRDILVDIAHAHRQVLQSPQPRALFVGFGDSALEFELRCVVSNIDDAPVVKSDLCFAILERFRAANIVIPYPQRELSWREGAKPGPVPPQRN